MMGPSPDFYCHECDVFDIAPHEHSPKTVPCKTCGEPTTFTGTKQCDDCHEVETRITGYIRRGGVKAKRFLYKVLIEDEIRNAAIIKRGSSKIRIKPR